MSWRPQVPNRTDVRFWHKADIPTRLIKQKDAAPINEITSAFLMPQRRFPPPWSVEVTPNCFIVRDANGQALSYVYYESEPGRRSAAKLLTRDEAATDRHMRVVMNVIQNTR